jgi:hypothetical protein
LSYLIVLCPALESERRSATLLFLRTIRKARAGARHPRCRWMARQDCSRLQMKADGLSRRRSSEAKKIIARDMFYGFGSYAEPRRERLYPRSCCRGRVKAARWSRPRTGAGVFLPSDPTGFFEITPSVLCVSNLGELDPERSSTLTYDKVGRALDVVEAAVSLIGRGSWLRTISSINRLPRSVSFETPIPLIACRGVSLRLSGHLPFTSRRPH